MFVRMGKLFLKKSLIETLTEFAKVDYKEDNEDRPSAGSFKDFIERTSQEGSKKEEAKPSTPSEDTDKK